MSPGQHSSPCRSGTGRVGGPSPGAEPGIPTPDWGSPLGRPGRLWSRHGAGASIRKWGERAAGVGTPRDRLPAAFVLGCGADALETGWGQLPLGVGRLPGPGKTGKGSVGCSTAPVSRQGWRPGPSVSACRGRGASWGQLTCPFSRGHVFPMVGVFDPLPSRVVHRETEAPGAASWLGRAWGPGLWCPACSLCGPQPEISDLSGPATGLSIARSGRRVRKAPRLGTEGQFPMSQW